MAETLRGVTRWLYWFMAGLFFTLAMIGVALPGLPTTPFLLLMCYFLLRVSPTLHAKAMAWPILGGPLRDWQDQRGVRRNVKRLAYSMVTLLVGSMLIFSPLPVVLKVVILCAAIYGISIVARLPIAHDELDVFSVNLKMHAHCESNSVQSDRALGVDRATGVEP